MIRTTLNMETSTPESATALIHKPRLTNIYIYIYISSHSAVRESQSLIQACSGLRINTGNDLNVHETQTENLIACLGVHLLFPLKKTAFLSVILWNKRLPAKSNFQRYVLKGVVGVQNENLVLYLCHPRCQSQRNEGSQGKHSRIFLHIVDFNVGLKVQNVVSVQL